MGNLIGFERLELRRLLAADCGFALTPMEPAICEIATMDTDVAVQQTSAMDDQASDPTQLDLSDGMDGYFGSISAEIASETVNFMAPADGMAEIVLSSSMGQGHAVLSVINSNGDPVELKTEQLGSFEISYFEVSEGESYQIDVSGSDSGCDGNFQLTVGFQGHTDQHVNEVGADSTELHLEGNHAELDGRLETSEDIDTFRFTSESNGEMLLQLQETVDDSRISLQVSVHDADGNLMVEGSTNESLRISDDVTAGNEYFISINSPEGQTGTYKLSLELTFVDPPATDDIGSEVQSTDQTEVDLADGDPAADDDDITIDPTVSDSSDDCEGEIVDTDPATEPADPVDEPVVDNGEPVILEETEPTVDDGEMVVTDDVDSNIAVVTGQEPITDDIVEINLDGCDVVTSVVDDCTDPGETEPGVLPGDLELENLQATESQTSDPADNDIPDLCDADIVVQEANEFLDALTQLESIDSYFESLAEDIDLSFEITFGPQGLDRILALV